MKTIRLISLLLLSLCVTAVEAATVTYVLDQSNVFGDSNDFLSVTLSDDTDGQLDFTVNTLEALGDIAGDNFGIQTFAFSHTEDVAIQTGNRAFEDGQYTVVSADDFLLPDGWSVDFRRNISEAGFFDFRLSGTGNSRQDPLQFSVLGLTVEDVQPIFAAHVAGFEAFRGDCGIDTFEGNGEGCHEAFTSGWFYGGRVEVVPLPASAWLLGSGLLGLFGVARRRQK